MKMQMQGREMPGLLLGVMDGASLEQRVMRLIDARLPWTRRQRVMSAALCALVMGLVCVGGTVTGVRLAAAQTQRVFRFDAATIKPSDPKETMSRIGMTPNGFEMVSMPLSRALEQAYFPMFERIPDPVRNAPAWLNDRYDIVAKVSPEDLGEWKKMLASIGQHPEVMQQALQAMLVDRMKLSVHRVPVETEGYALVVSSRGPRLAETNAGPPSAGAVIRLPDGGNAALTADSNPAEWTFYHTSMDALVHYLQGNMQRPLVNQTGLNGKYHFVLHQVDFNDIGEAARTPDGSNQWKLNEIGLALKPIKVKGEAIVIDHIERPTEN